MSQSAVNGHTLPDNGNVAKGYDADMAAIVTACRIFAAAIDVNGAIDASAVSGAIAITDSTAAALAVGQNGATNPTFVVDAATASSATGIKVKSAAAAAGVAISAISSGTNEALTIDAKGTGKITLGATSTGNISIQRKLELFLSGGAASASGLLMGTGTSANPATTSTADAKFIEVRAQTTATSGDNRLMYLRYDQNGAAGGGECIRALGKITAALGTARGIHGSADLSADGSVTGLCVGIDAQLMIADALPAGGTYYAGQSQIWAPASSSVAAVTAHAIHSFTVDGGDATAQATVKNCFAINGAEGSGNMIYNNDSTGATESNGSIRILVNEGAGLVARYLRYWDAENS